VTRFREELIIVSRSEGPTWRPRLGSRESIAPRQIGSTNGLDCRWLLGRETYVRC
jgi:hypothetical protein